MALRLTLLALCCLLLLDGAAEAQSTNPHFGVIESYEAPQAATELGVGWTRVRFPWAEVQPDNPQQWQPLVADETIAAERAAGREVVGLLIGIPQWARDADDLPQGLYLAYDDPDNLWANYVRTAVERYQGQINHWIIWNEPDIWDETTPGYTWHGDVADFAQLMRVAYHVAKETNPDAVIHLASMTFFWDNNFGRTQYLERLLSELSSDPQAASHGYYFDIASAHLYFQPNQILDILNIWQEMMRQYQLDDKRWWLVETNAPVSDDPSWPVEQPLLTVSQQDQAAFIPQMIAVAFAANVERIAIFKLIDTESDRFANPEPFGLLRADGSPRPAFDAYQVAIDLLANVESGQLEQWDDAGRVRLMHADGSTTHVLFARGSQPVTVEVEAWSTAAELVTLFGERQQIAPQNGVYRVTLDGSACTQPIGDGCMIGGMPQYLIQQPPQPTPAPTITRLVAPSLTPSPAQQQPAATATAAPPTATPALPAAEIDNGRDPSLAVAGVLLLFVAAFIVTRRLL